MNDNILSAGDHDFSRVIAAANDTLKCPSCKGRGYTESMPFIEWADDETRVFSTIKMKCTVCKGTGKRIT